MDINALCIDQADLAKAKQQDLEFKDARSGQELVRAAQFFDERMESPDRLD